MWCRTIPLMFEGGRIGERFEFFREGVGKWMGLLIQVKGNYRIFQGGDSVLESSRLPWITVTIKICSD